MVETSIALNRFGLGARPDEPLPDNPRKWLLDQFARFEPRPAAIAAAPDSRAVSADLAKYLEEQRQLRQQLGPRRQQPGQAAPATMRPPGGEPAMMTPQAAPAMTDGMSARPGMPATEPPARKDDALTQARQFARRQGRDDYATAVGARTTTALTSPALLGVE